MMKKLTPILFVLSLLLLPVNSASAKWYDFAIQKAQKVEEKIQTKLENRASSVSGTKNKIEQKLVKVMGQKAILKSAKVTARDESALTVEVKGKSYMVTVTSQTKFRRHFWGKSSLDEVSVGDVVNVFGKWANEEKTQITASMIRNLSVQKKNGVFFGEVVSISGNTFVIKTIKRENQTVTIGSAKLVNRKQETITKADILVGHRIRVKGLWDKTAKTITEVVQIKDFSIPLAPSPKPTGIDE